MHSQAANNVRAHQATCPRRAGVVVARGMNKRHHTTTLRLLVQCFFAGLCIAAGWRFLAFLDWAGGAGGAPIPRPAGVEGFLPLAALIGFKHLLLTGGYDPVHPAGLTILFAALATAWVCRKGFCGFLCPVGLASDRLGALGKRLGLARSLPRSLDRVLGSIKYLLLAFFLVSIFILMDPAATEQFLNSAYNRTADARLLGLFLHPSGTFLAVVCALGVAGLVFRNALCRWLCPYGALLGLAALSGPLAIRHEAEACRKCGRCRKACPYDIPVGQAAGSPVCVACGQCLEACPQKNVLRLRFFGKAIPWQLAVVGSVLVFASLCLALGSLCGWTAALPPAMARMLYAALPG